VARSDHQERAVGHGLHRGRVRPAVEDRHVVKGFARTGDVQNLLRPASDVRVILTRPDCTTNRPAHGSPSIITISPAPTVRRTVEAATTCRVGASNAAK